MSLGAFFWWGRNSAGERTTRRADGIFEDVHANAADQVGIGGRDEVALCFFVPHDAAEEPSEAEALAAAQIRLALVGLQRGGKNR